MKSTKKISKDARKLDHKSSKKIFPDSGGIRCLVDNQFRSNDSNMHLTRGSLRKRVTKDLFRGLYWNLILYAIVVIVGFLAPSIKCEDSSNHEDSPASNSLTSTLTDEIRSILPGIIPDQDCVFPYFKKYTGACVAHRYVNGQSYYYHVPEKLVTGYVVLIHGAGVGRSEDWFVRINRIPMMKKFIDSGFAVAAVQSVAQWTMLTRERDLRNQDGAFWQIVRETGMDPNLPVFAVCVSRGCQYQGWMAETLHRQRRPIRGQYMSIPWGVTRQFLRRSSSRMPPTIVAVGGTDTVPMVNTVREMQPWIDSIRARGVEANLFVNKKKNVDTCFHSLCRFPETGGLNTTRRLVREMENQGVIDTNGSIIIPLPAMQGVENPYERLIIDAYMGVTYLKDWPIFSADGPMIDWIYQELSEMQGGHRHTSDFDLAVMNMFLRQTLYGRVNDLVHHESVGL